MRRSLGSHIAGDGSLYRPTAKGEADAVYRKHQLIDAHPLGTDLLGKKDTIKKSHKAADHTRYSQNGSPCKNRTFPETIFKTGQEYSPTGEISLYIYAV
jgi:hypothetical protein